MILLLGDFDLNTPVLGAFQNHESKLEVKEVVTEPTGSASSSPAAAEEDSSETIKSKKRSRWGTKQESASELNGKAEQGIDDGNTEKKRRSRWGNDATDKTSSETTTAMTARSGTQLRNLHQQKTFLLRLKIDDINRKLLTVVQDAKIAENNPERSPSPEPIYDSQGRRINLREARMREGLETKKKEFMEELVKLNPALKPSNMRMSLISKKLYVPVHDYPGYNFLGLIIGPRGLTQKRMETETNTKITIRGKGSVRPGRGKQEEDANEELHILVEGEDQDDVDRAADMVSKLLNPNTDEHILEEHRQKQMQELALINGTIKQDDVCINCGQAGHKLYECPYQSIASFTMANVTCKICGEKSHVTADCPMKNTINGNIPVFAGNDIINEGIDKDYYEFLEMVGGEKDPNSLPAVQASAGPQPLSMSQMNTPVLTPSQSGFGHNSTLPKTTGGQQNFQSGVTASVIPTVSINQYTPFNTYTAPLPGAIPVAYTVPTHVDLTMRRLPVYSGMVQPVQPLQQAYMLPNNYTLLQQPQYIPPPPPMPTQTQQGNMSRSGLPFPPLPQ